MGIEIERKFLVATDAWGAAATSSAAYRQGYLSEHAKATVRIRIIDDLQAILTIKGPPVGLVRPEFEYDVPLDEGRAMLEMARPAVVEKRRYLVPHGGMTWEVDVFEGGHEGLVLAEIELPSADAEFERPDWLGAEVSHDHRYANASLARNPGVPALDPDAA